VGVVLGVMEVEGVGLGEDEGVVEGDIEGEGTGATTLPATEMLTAVPMAEGQATRVYRPPKYRVCDSTGKLVWLPEVHIAFAM